MPFRPFQFTNDHEDHMNFLKIAGLVLFVMLGMFGAYLLGRSSVSPKADAGHFNATLSCGEHSLVTKVATDGKDPDFICDPESGAMAMLQVNGTGKTLVAVVVTDNEEMVTVSVDIPNGKAFIDSNRFRMVAAFPFGTDTIQAFRDIGFPSDLVGHLTSSPVRPAPTSTDL